MKCPKCSAEQLCPCTNCADLNAGKVTWRWDGDLISCGHCGHTMHVDAWHDVEVREASVAAKD